MCLAVYLAADQPLHVVQWDDAHPAFYVAPLDPSDLLVRKQFTKFNVMYVGSHEGCGCGFQCGEYPQDLEPERATAMRESLDRFADYLEAEVGRVGPMELYVCWEGDQATPPEHRRVLTPAMLRRNDFFFLQNELSLVDRLQQCSS